MGGKAPGTSWECSLELTFCYCVLRASAQVECFWVNLWLWWLVILNWFWFWFLLVLSWLCGNGFLQFCFLFLVEMSKIHFRKHKLLFCIFVILEKKVESNGGRYVTSPTLIVIFYKLPLELINIKMILSKWIAI